MQQHCIEYCGLLAADEYIFTDVLMQCVYHDLCCHIPTVLALLLWIFTVTLNCLSPSCPPTGRPQVRPAVWFRLETAFSFALLRSSVQLGHFIISTSHCPLPLVCCACLLLFSSLAACPLVHTVSFAHNLWKPSSPCALYQSAPPLCLLPLPSVSLGLPTHQRWRLSLLLPHFSPAVDRVWQMNTMPWLQRATSCRH